MHEDIKKIYENDSVYKKLADERKEQTDKYDRYLESAIKCLEKYFGKDFTDIKFEKKAKMFKDTSNGLTPITIKIKDSPKPITLILTNEEYEVQGMQVEKKEKKSDEFSSKEIIELIKSTAELTEIQEQYVRECNLAELTAQLLCCIKDKKVLYYLELIRKYFSDVTFDSELKIVNIEEKLKKFYSEKKGE